MAPGGDFIVGRRIGCMVAAIAVVVGMVALPGISASATQPVTLDKLVSDDPANFTPNVLDGEVDKIVKSGTKMVISGLFSQVQETDSTTTLARQNIVAFDASTGAIDPNFNPTIDGQVQAMALNATGTVVYIGGLFNNVNGQPFTGIAALHLSDGSLVPTFKPPVLDALVEDVALRDNTLYVSGAFKTAKKGGVTYTRGGLLGLDPTKGKVLDSPAVQFTGTHRGTGVTRVTRIDFTPAGDRMVAVGNFSTVDGQDRNQLAMIDLTTTPASVVPNWQTNAYKPTCSSFQYYIRDVEFSPDGSYFIVGATGAAGNIATQLCDTVTRWPTYATGPGTGLTPTWTAFTGGDTTYAVGVTDAAVYVGGHQRWWNNPFGRDSAGQGAVSRQGIGALDPVNGLPLSWNPTRERGTGVFDFLTSTEGLWVASDTDRIGQQYEYHARIAFFPLTGGRTLPLNRVGSLPSDVYQLGRWGADPNTTVLYRVNAGGDSLQSLDNGPDWAADSSTAPSSLHNTGSNTSTYSTLVTTLNASVPSTTPRAVFSSNREDPSGGNEMQWRFPVAAGVPVQVRLYFANRNNSTGTVGSRQFDISIDGSTVLSNYDIVADTGNQTGTMKPFDRTSDGSVDIDFTHRKNNPLISAIEIIGTDSPTPPSSNGDTVSARSFNGTTAGAVRTPRTGGVAWSSARGATMVDGTVYTAMQDGNVYARSYDGSTWGDPVNVDTADLIVPMSTWHSEIPNITAMFYNGGRLYYTLFGQKALYYRYFTPESYVVGAQEFTAAPANLGDLDWSNLQGGFVAGGTFYYVTRSDGVMHRADWANGTAISGSSVSVSGPGIDGVDWRAKALFLASFGSVDNKPTASFTSNCSGATCTFDGLGSSDDSAIASYLWDFGDGTPVGSGAQTAHTYTKGGTYHVTLTVTDNIGQTGSKTADVFADIANILPTAAFSGSCTTLTCSINGSASSDPDGSIVSYAWDFGDDTTGSGASPSHAYASAGTYSVNLTVTDDSGGTASVTDNVTATAPVTPIGYVGTTSNNVSAGNNTVSVPAGVQAGDGLLLFETDNGNGVTATAPAGWTLVDTATSGTATTRLWQRTAPAGSAGSQVTVSFSTSVKSAVQMLAYTGTSSVGPVANLAKLVEPTGTTSLTHTTPTVTVDGGGSWVVSYWADKSSTTTRWSLPGSVAVRGAPSIGTGTAHITAAVADSNQPLASGVYGGLTASTDQASRALMMTVVLAPAG